MKKIVAETDAVAMVPESEYQNAVELKFTMVVPNGGVMEVLPPSELNQFTTPVGWNLYVTVMLGCGFPLKKNCGVLNE